MLHRCAEYASRCELTNGTPTFRVTLSWHGKPCDEQTASLRSFFCLNTQSSMSPSTFPGYFLIQSSIRAEIVSVSPLFVFVPAFHPHPRFSFACWTVDAKSVPIDWLARRVLLPANRRFRVTFGAPFERIRKAYRRLHTFCIRIVCSSATHCEMVQHNDKFK